MSALLINHFFDEITVKIKAALKKLKSPKHYGLAAQDLQDLLLDVSAHFDETLRQDLCNWSAYIKELITRIEFKEDLRDLPQLKPYLEAWHSKNLTYESHVLQMINQEGQISLEDRTCLENFLKTVAEIILNQIEQSTEQRKKVTEALTQKISLKISEDSANIRKTHLNQKSPADLILEFETKLYMNDLKH